MVCVVKYTKTFLVTCYQNWW